MKQIIVLLMAFQIISCTNSKLYKQIEENVTLYHLKDSVNKIVLSRNFNPSKIIFKKLNNKISSKIIYIFSWTDHGAVVGTRDFRAVIYDSQKVFYIWNERKRPSKFCIQDSNKGFTVEKFILKNYIDSNLHYLRTLENEPLTDSFGTDYYWYNTEK